MFPEGDWLELVTAVTEMVLQLRIDIRKPLHSIKLKIAQNQTGFDNVPIGIRFSLIEKRSGKQMAYEDWHFTFSRHQALGSNHNRMHRIFMYLTYVHDLLMRLPLWAVFLNS
jgi:hypothetical protein